MTNQPEQITEEAFEFSEIDEALNFQPLTEDNQEIKDLARLARELSQKAVEANQQGKLVEGHRLMTQAVEAGRKSRQLINQPKIEKVLAQFEKNQQ